MNASCYHQDHDGLCTCLDALLNPGFARPD
jgi:hypothetical protein